MEIILKYFPDLTEAQKQQFASLYDLYTANGLYMRRSSSEHCECVFAYGTNFVCFGVYRDNGRLTQYLVNLSKQILVQENDYVPKTLKTCTNTTYSIHWV